MPSKKGFWHYRPIIENPGLNVNDSLAELIWGRLAGRVGEVSQ